MENKPNLNKLAEEIESRKAQRNVNPNLGVGTTGINGQTPRDVFLGGLMESLKTGNETQSTALLKTVENETLKKDGKAPLMELNTHKSQHTTQVMADQERDEQMFNDIQKKHNKTLAESIGDFSGVQTPNYNQYNTGLMPQQQLNESLITGVVDKYLMNNFGHVVEESIKSTILEMYAAERVKEVLNENKDLIKKIVYETIREIQNKNKK